MRGLSKIILISTILIALALSGCVSNMKTGSIVEVGGGFNTNGVTIGKVQQLEATHPDYNALVTMPQGWYVSPVSGNSPLRVSGYGIPMNTPYLPQTLNVYYVGETGQKEIDLVTINYSPTGQGNTIGSVNTKTLDNSFTITYTPNAQAGYITY